MTTDEAARLHLYEQARASWDDEAARTLVTALPWDVADLATKEDLHREVELVRYALEGKIDRASSETLRTMVFSVIMTNITIAGLVMIGIQLAG